MTELKISLKPGLDLLISVSHDQSQHAFSIIDATATITPICNLNKSWLTSKDKKEELFLALSEKLPERVDNLEMKISSLSVKILEVLNKTKKDKGASEIKTEKIDWISGISFSKLREIYNKWIYMKDDYALRVTVATALSQKLPGIPVWLFLKAPPSNTKSVYITALGDSPTELSYPMSEFTAASLITGHAEGEDLMAKFDGKIVPISDFSSFLTQPDDERAKIFSKLRVMFDGKYRKGFGGEVSEKDIKIHCTLIAGVVDDIERYRNVISNLGDRYLFCRVINDDKKASEKAQAVSKIEKEGEMTNELKQYTLSFIKGVWDSGLLLTVTIPPLLEMKIRTVARFLGVMRTPVSRDKYGRFHYSPATEGSMRLTKQFSKLAKSLAAIDGRNEVNEYDIDIIQRVSLDSVPEIRTKVISSLITEVLDSEKDDIYFSIPRFEYEISHQIKLPPKTVEFFIEDLMAIGVIEQVGIETSLPSGEIVNKIGVQLIAEFFDEFKIMLGDTFTFNYKIVENIKRRTTSLAESLITSQYVASKKVINIELKQQK